MTAPDWWLELAGKGDKPVGEAVWNALLEAAATQRAEATRRGYTRVSRAMLPYLEASQAAHTAFFNGAALEVWASPADEAAARTLMRLMGDET